MTDPDRYESVVDRQIRLAQERGDFDDLPGKGKPFKGLHDPYDELWWVKDLIRREGLSTELLLPPSMQLRKEIDRLPDTLRTLRSEREVRDVVSKLNLRIVEFLRAPVGPRLPVKKVDAEDAVRQWRAGRAQPESSPESSPEPSATAVRPRRAPRWRRLCRWR